MAYDAGRRAVTIVREDLTPHKIMTRQAFENSIIVASAIAASTNVPIHINAIARHVGVDLSNQDWHRVGCGIPVLVNLAPAGEFLGEDFYRAGGVPAVMRSLLAAGHLHGDAAAQTRTSLSGFMTLRYAVIRPSAICTVSTE
jgi:dihydroxy-acid dehydratase